MAQGVHVHEWIYGEPREVAVNGKWGWRVVRFCKECQEVEDLELKQKK